MTSAGVFTHPFMYWVGMNTAADTSQEELAKFNDFYSNTHVPEVVTSNPGFVRATRYELYEPDPRGDHDTCRWWTDAPHR